jgi:hypothetical protein
MSAWSDFAENKSSTGFSGLKPLAITGASAGAGTGPTALYVGLFTANPSDTGGGTEVTGNAYARVTVTSALTAWDNTQAASSSAVSSGTGGTTRNQASIDLPTPTPLAGVR